MTDPSPEVVALDVGGTTIKAARVAPDGVRVERRDTPSGGALVLDAVRRAAAELRTPATAAVGIVTAGLVDAQAGLVRFAANLGWRNVALRDAVGTDLGLPVALGNDVAAAARAEHAARPAPDLLYVSIGTGIAARHVVDGRVAEGHRGAAGELGHVVAVPGGEPCACGGRGCVEAYASGGAIARRYAALAGGGRTAAEVLAADDSAAHQVLDDATGALAAGLAAAVALLDPGEIVVGGGVSAAGEALLAPLRSRVAGLLPWRDAPALQLGEYGGDAGWRGAAELALGLTTRLVRS